MKYRAVYERDTDGRWSVDIPQVPGCRTYGRTIDQARERVREELALYVNKAQSAEIEDDVRLPAGIRKRVAAVKKLRERVTRDELAMVKAQIDVVAALRRHARLGHRDVGRLLELSHQRVHQLEKRAPRDIVIRKGQPAARARRRS
jgi:predicted RNase H-like HicB family nuclease